jgi:hypothetical protein
VIINSADEKNNEIVFFSEDNIDEKQTKEQIIEVPVD